MMCFLGRNRRRTLLASDLLVVFREIDNKSYEQTGPRSWSFDLDRAFQYLKENELQRNILSRSRSRKTLPLNSDRHIYNLQDVIVKDLHIKLDKNLNFMDRYDLQGLSHAKWHFENCRFESESSNMASLSFPWRGDFRFVRNEFFFPNSNGMRAWLFAFTNGSRVLFDRNDFGSSHIQITNNLPDDEDQVEKISWENISAYVVKDDSYIKERMREHHGFSSAVRIEVPNSYTPRLHMGIHDLSLLGNRGIDQLDLMCNAASYVFRGVNRINRLAFIEPHFENERINIYIGPREIIDPHFHYCLQHRRLFLSIREMGIRNQDNFLVRVLDKQLDRIEYFLNKEQKIPVQFDSAMWIDYWQDRCLLAWRRWSSDFYRSWLRPLTVLIIGYLAMNAFPAFCIENFTVANWIEFSLRAPNRIPFYPSVAEKMAQGARSARHSWGFRSHVVCSSGSPCVKLNHKPKWPGNEVRRVPRPGELKLCKKGSVVSEIGTIIVAKRRCTK